MRDKLFFSVVVMWCLILSLTCQAQATFDTSAAAAWQELPASPTMWKAGTNYKVTSHTTVKASGSIPANLQIAIISNGALTINDANIKCGPDVAIYVAGGSLSINNSSMSTDTRCILYEGELGSISLTNSRLSMGSGSVLTINGRHIKGNNSSIKGNATTLVAPIKRVFDNGITIDGTWLIDRAYPQWFKDDNTQNWAVAINKAIKMKGTGEVFLPRGEYAISSSIYVTFGIKLTGEAGREKSGKNSTCTTIVPATGSDNHFNGGYMMLVNVKHEDDKGNILDVDQETAQWETHYPNAGTQLQNLTFTCNNSQCYKGVLVAGGVIIDQVTWNKCLQAVASASNTYDDQRVITNCSFYPAGNKVRTKKREPLYAFDLKSLGDALVFTGNAVHSSDQYTKALRLFLCDGGNISANILNADVLIDRCKGISFSSNHCEMGAAVTIIASTVVNNSNFYEKGSTPSVIITGSTGSQSSSVTINGDQFVYYNGLRSTDKGPETASEAAKRLTEMSEHDIALDEKSQLALNSCYRYDVPMTIGIGTQNLFGVNVASINNKGEYSPNKAFNRYSHMLSQAGTIGKAGKLNNSFRHLSPGQSRIYLYGKATATWIGESGDYSYSFEILDDKGRVTNQSSSMPSVTENNPSIHLEKGKDGVLLCIADTGEAGKNVYVKLRRRGADGVKTVEFPVAGSEHIYDNGISVAGYKWK